MQRQKPGAKRSTGRAHAIRDVWSASRIRTWLVRSTFPATRPAGALTKPLVFVILEDFARYGDSYALGRIRISAVGP